jgi:hypothetical protein
VRAAVVAEIEARMVLNERAYERVADTRTRDARPVTFENVRVAPRAPQEHRPRGERGGRRALTFHPESILDGSTVEKVGDGGTLVMLHWVAVSLGLV